MVCAFHKMHSCYFFVSCRRFQRGGQTHERGLPGSFVYRQAGTSHWHRTLQRLQPKYHSIGRDAILCLNVRRNVFKRCKDMQRYQYNAKICQDTVRQNIGKTCRRYCQLIQRYTQNCKGMPRYVELAKTTLRHFATENADQMSGYAKILLRCCEDIPKYAKI